jgi:ribosomal silencing factor RsfS
MMHLASDEVFRSILTSLAYCCNVEKYQEVTPNVDKEEDWRARNKTVNRLALVCTQFHRAVTAPLDAPGGMLERRLTAQSGDALHAAPDTWHARERWWLNVKLHERGGSVALLQVATYCWKLTSLDVTCCNTYMTDELIIQVAQKCVYLKYLCVDNCWRLTDASIIAVARRCRQLTSLDVAACSLTDASIIAVAAGCGHLQSLNVEFCTSLTDASIIAVAEGCGQLKSLNVEFCTSLTDASIIAVAKGRGQLTSLNVAGCNLTDASIIAVAQRCPKLTSLDVAACSLTDTSIIAVAQSCPNLTSLDVAAIGKLTDSSIMAVVQGCVQLTSLNVEFCTSLTDAQRCRQLTPPLHVATGT